MNTDYFYQSIVDSLSPTDDMTQDARDLIKTTIMYGISVENIDDVKTASNEIERINKMYIDHYTASGKLDEFNKVFDQMKEDEKENIEASMLYMTRIMKRESGMETVEPIAPTGDPDKDALTFVEEYIKMFDEMQDVSDALLMDHDYQIKFGDIFALYDEGTPNEEAFNNAIEKYSVELNLEGHQEAKNDIGEKLGNLLA